MPLLTPLLNGFAWINLAFWSSVAAIAWAGERRNRRLADCPPAEDRPGAPLPRLAVLVPALNEEAAIEAALESLATQSYPNLLILPINDRSTDRTGALMDAVAARRPNVHPLHIETLPPQWLGKNHANHLGAQQAMAEGAQWLLFTDGDVKFSPDALRKAVRYARKHGLHHLAVSPELAPGGFWEEVFVTAFLVWFMNRFQPWNVESPRSKRYVGIGAFNLVHADAYRALGGHEPLALTVADDMALGWLVKRSGFRQGFLNGEGEVRVRWQHGFWAHVRGLYKNSFASMNFNLPFTLFAAAFILAVNTLAYLLPWLTTGASRLAACLGLALLLAVYYRFPRGQGRPALRSVGIAACGWFGGLMFAWVLLASAFVTLRRGGVAWRGTLYPTSLLRNRQVRLP